MERIEALKNVIRQNNNFCRQNNVTEDQKRLAASQTVLVEKLIEAIENNDKTQQQLINAELVSWQKVMSTRLMLSE